MNSKNRAYPLIAFATLLILLFSSGMSAQITFNEGDQKLKENYKRANPIYLKAMKFLAKNDVKKAEEKANECLAIMPQHAPATYLLAQLYLKQKNLPKALETIVKAKENFMTMSQLITFTHQEYMDSLRKKIEGLESQKANLQESLSQIPTSSTSRVQYEGPLTKIEGQLNIIRKQLQEPIPKTYDIPADYHFIHGNALFQMRRLGEAEEQYKKAIETDPTHSFAYNNLSLVLFSQKKFNEAQEYLMRAESAGAKVNPDFKKALNEKIDQLTAKPAG